MNYGLIALMLAGCASTHGSASGEARPNRREKQRLQAEAMAAYEKKDFTACAASMRRATDWYGAACCSALAGQRDTAFAELERASTVGDLQPEHVPQDTDLESLRTDPRWAPMLAAFAASYQRVQAANNAELRTLFEDDQADRRAPNIDWATVAPRDVAREQRVQAILDAHGAKTSSDYYHAAMVYQHGTTPAQAQRAHDLAVKAVELNESNEAARWLAAASEDRRLMYEHKPQRYGTQFTKKPGSDEWVLYDVDPSVTDDERAQWNVPTLDEARQRAVKLNAQKR